MKPEKSIKSMTRKEAETALRLADIAELPRFLAHPSPQVQKRARFKLAIFAQNLRLCQGRTSKVGQTERKMLAHLIDAYKPISARKAGVELGLTQGRVKAGLSALADMNLARGERN